MLYAYTTMSVQLVVVDFVLLDFVVKTKKEIKAIILQEKKIQSWL